MPRSLDSHTISVLLIENESDVLAGLAKTLGAAGYTCHCSCDRASALELAPQVQPDLIIADINLAGTSGLALCEQIQQQPGLSDVPMMFLSGAQIPGIIRRSHAAGGVYYLRKPFDAQVMLELVDRALSTPVLVQV